MYCRKFRNAWSHNTIIYKCRFRKIIIPFYDKGFIVVFIFFLLQQQQRNESVTPTPESDPVYVNRAALLPAYRPSPGYETVMQQRMLHQQQQQQNPQHHLDDITPHLGSAQVYIHPEGMAYSQPEISQNIANNYRDEHGNYVNVEALRNYGHSIYANIFQDDHNFYGVRGTGERSTHLAVHPTYSSPELNSEIHQPEAFVGGDLNAQDSLLYHYKPPPPYPRASSSTPDLAAQMPGSVHLLVSSEIPRMQEQQNVSGLSLQQETIDIHEFMAQSNHLHKSAENIPTMLGYSSPTPFVQQVVNVDASMHHPGTGMSTNNNNISSSNTGFQSSVAEGGVDVDFNNDSDEDNENEDAQRTLTRDAVMPQEFMDASDGQRVVSDDQEDTSSEHSYSTFHAKESDDSSEEETSPKQKVEVEGKDDEPKIHIRMFAAEEAPPPSKIKEEAMLRESFRRMKIARTRSMNTRDSIRSSLRNVKEASEIALSSSISSGTSTIISSTNEENHNSQSNVMAFPRQIYEMPLNSNDQNTEASAMKEILERLGAPPPYPGSAFKSDVDSKLYPNNNNNVSDFENVPHSVVQNATPVPMAGVAFSNATKHHSPVSITKHSQASVKRSSSMGTAPQSAPILPPRKPIPNVGSSVKPRAATFSLDTVVPISKPGIVLYNKDVERGTSVLKSDSNASVSVTDSDSDSVKCLSEKDSRDSGRLQQPKGDMSLDTHTLGSLPGDFYDGSDSESDTERVS